MYNKYINNLKDHFFNKSKNPISYTLFLDKWKNENSKLALIAEDDNFYAHMGCKVIDILLHSDILSMTLVRSVDKKHPYQALQVKDKTLMTPKSRKYKVDRLLLIYLLNYL